MSESKRIRCAIYTRKSSEEGLDQSFNSLHAQREACEAYILSQKHEGWETLASVYDDGGFSGGNMERPGLRRLLADISAKLIDTVVVYKVDRLTRSSTDFAKIVEQFDGQGVSFVSVTQQFNTTSSMGRLTLNVLLSFAQFEREVTGERIRDKIAASKRKGMWMGGVIPLGYDLQDRCLVLQPEEAERVRTIYRLYLVLGCVSMLQITLDERGIRSKKRISKTGRTSGDSVFSRGSLYELLQNPLYLGEVRHKKTVYPGQQPAIVDRKLWDQVQAKLGDNRRLPRQRATSPQSHLLTGILFDTNANRFTPSHTWKGNRCHRYYVSQTAIQAGTRKKDPALRLPAKEIEAVVLNQMTKLMHSPQQLAEVISVVTNDSSELQAIIKSVAEQNSESMNSDALLECVQRIVVEARTVVLSIDCARLRRLLGLPEAAAPLGTKELSCSATLHRVGAELRFEVPAELRSARPNPPLMRAIVNAHDWLDQIQSGRVPSQREMAKQAGVTESFLGRMMSFAFLAPEIVEAALEGNQPSSLSVEAFRGRVDLDWNLQRRSNRGGILARSKETMPTACRTADRCGEAPGVEQASV